jgi:hypothetical protein
MAMYAHPLLWVGLAIVAIAGFKFIWLTLVGKSSPSPFAVGGAVGRGWMMWRDGKRFGWDYG